MAAHRDAIERALLDRYGRTYSEDAGIRPLFPPGKGAG